MCLVGIIGNNWLCISSLSNSMSQLRTSDILFINLAVSNLITNYLVDILSILHTEEYIPAGKLFCSIRFFLPEFSETSSIMSTMFITIYWHQKLVGSLKRGGASVKMDNLQFVAMLLIGSWTFAFVLNVSHLFFVAEMSENVTNAECREELPSQEAEQAYEAIYIILANVIPLVGILYASIQITITLMKNDKRMKKMGAENNKDNNNGKSKSQAKTGSLLRAAKSVVAVAILFLICWTIHLLIIIIGSISATEETVDVESFIGAFYTCLIPYIYLYGVQKLTCFRTRRVADQERVTQ